MPICRIIESPDSGHALLRAIQEADSEVSYRVIHPESPRDAISLVSSGDPDQDVILVNPVIGFVAQDPGLSVGFINQFFSALFVCGFDSLTIDVNLTECESRFTPAELDYWLSLVQSPLLNLRDHIRYIDLNQTEPDEPIN